MAQRMTAILLPVFVLERFMYGEQGLRNAVTVTGPWGTRTMDFGPDKLQRLAYLYSFGHGGAGFKYTPDQLLGEINLPTGTDGPVGTGALFGTRAGWEWSTSGVWSTQCGASRNERPCKVRWCDADHPNKNVRPGVMEEIQALANKAHVDLTLSSGIRRGPCYLTNRNGRGSMHNCGLAVDISAVNGVDVGQGRITNPAAAGLIELVMGTAKTMIGVRENLGPLGLWKATNYGDRQTRFYNAATQNIHYNQIHIGVHPIEWRRGP